MFSVFLFFGRKCTVPSRNSHFASAQPQKTHKWYVFCGPGSLFKQTTRVFISPAQLSVKLKIKSAIFKDAPKLKIKSTKKKAPRPFYRRA